MRRLFFFTKKSGCVRPTVYGDSFSAKIKTGGKLRGREVDAAAKESYRMLFGTDTQTAPSFEEWKSAVSEYADVPWAELADRAKKTAMLPKAEEVRSNR